MTLDLDQIINAVLPAWEFFVKDGGNEFPTRAPSLGELAALESISHADLAGDVGRDLILSLFPAIIPPVNDWKPQKRLAFVAGYLRWWARKNYQAAGLLALKQVQAADMQSVN